MRIHYRCLQDNTVFFALSFDSVDSYSLVSIYYWTLFLTSLSLTVRDWILIMLALQFLLWYWRITSECLAVATIQLDVAISAITIHLLQSILKALLAFLMANTTNLFTRDGKCYYFMQMHRFYFLHDSMASNTVT